MRALTRAAAVEKLLSWKSAGSCINLVVKQIQEKEESDLVAIFAVAEDCVQLTSGPRGYGFILKDAFITGDDDFLQFEIGSIRYSLSKVRSN